MTDPGDHLNFGERLSFAQGAAGDPAWAEAYRVPWPGCKLIDLRSDQDAQQHAVDRVALKTDGTQARIEEKVREREYQGDILLELWHWEHVPLISSSRPRGAKQGWMELHEGKRSTHISILYLLSQWCLLLPWDETERAWEQRKAEWKKLAAARIGCENVWTWATSGPTRKREGGDSGFSLIASHSENHGHEWRTLSLAVPERHLLSAIVASMRIGYGRSSGVVRRES